VVIIEDCFLMTCTSRKGILLLASVSIVNWMVGHMPLMWHKNSWNLSGPCGHITKLSSIYRSHNDGLWAAVLSASSSKCSMKRMCLFAIVCLCAFYVGILAPFACCGLWVAVSLIATRFLSLASSVSRVCVGLRVPCFIWYTCVS
jgi:hypothetical protein